MADPVLAMIGGITLFILVGGAILALVIYSTQGFLALYRKMYDNRRASK